MQTWESKEPLAQRLIVPNSHNLISSLGLWLVVIISNSIIKSSFKQRLSTPNDQITDEKYFKGEAMTGHRTRWWVADVWKNKTAFSENWLWDCLKDESKICVTAVIGVVMPGETLNEVHRYATWKCTVIWFCLKCVLKNAIMAVLIVQVNLIIKQGCVPVGKYLHFDICNSEKMYKLWYKEIL